MRGQRRCRCREDCVPNTFDIFHHLVIPETQDAVTMCDEPSFAHDITSVIRVLTAVDLDNKPPLPAYKIDNIRPDRLLAHEFVSGKRPGAKVSPQLAFGACGIFP